MGDERLRDLGLLHLKDKPAELAIELGKTLAKFKGKGRSYSSEVGVHSTLEPISKEEFLATPSAKKLLSELQDKDAANLYVRAETREGHRIFLIDIAPTIGGPTSKLTYSVDQSTSEILAELAQHRSGEVTVKVKIVDQGGGKVLALNRPTVRQ